MPLELLRGPFSPLPQRSLVGNVSYRREHARIVYTISSNINLYQIENDGLGEYGLIMYNRNPLVSTNLNLHQIDSLRSKLFFTMFLFFRT